MSVTSDMFYDLRSDYFATRDAYLKAEAEACAAGKLVKLGRKQVLRDIKVFSQGGVPLISFAHYAHLAKIAGQKLAAMERAYQLLKAYYKNHIDGGNVDGDLEKMWRKYRRLQADRESYRRTLCDAEEKNRNTPDPMLKDVIRSCRSVIAEMDRQLEAMCPGATH